MPAPKPIETAVVFNEVILWHLKCDTRIREIGTTGREFVVGNKPGRLWHGATPCTIADLEMPVEIISRAQK